MNDTLTLAIAGSFLLGLRHGIDWDHLAAITDIIGAKSSQPSVGKLSFADEQKEAIKLTSFYAFGHAAIVIVLGIAAINFAMILPQWIDPIMERLVGLTLLILGFWIIYSLWRYLQGREKFTFVSRWMLIFAFVQATTKWITSKVVGDNNKRSLTVGQYQPKAAFLVGVLHGIGAETGTQILLITAVASTVRATGTAMLLAFAAGLIASNVLIGALGSAGFLSIKNSTRLFAFSGAATAIFSLIVGSFFITGHIENLPDLQSFFCRPQSN